MEISSKLFEPWGSKSCHCFFFFFIRNTLKKVHFSGLLLVGDVYDDVIFSGYNHFNVELTVLGAITPEDMNPF